MISDPETSFHSDLRFEKENSITPHEKLVQILVILKRLRVQAQHFQHDTFYQKRAKQSSSSATMKMITPNTSLYIKGPEQQMTYNFVAQQKISNHLTSARSIHVLSTCYPRCAASPCHVDPCRCEPWRPSSKERDRVGQTSVIPPRSKKLNGRWRIRWIMICNDM